MWLIYSQHFNSHNQVVGCFKRQSRWRRKWQPTPLFLPGKSQGQKSLAGHSLSGHKESDATDGLSTHMQRFLGGSSWARLGHLNPAAWVAVQGRSHQLGCPLPPSSYTAWRRLAVQNGGWVLGDQSACIWILSWSLSSFTALGKQRNFAVPQFFHL